MDSLLPDKSALTRLSNAVPDVDWQFAAPITDLERLPGSDVFLAVTPTFERESVYVVPLTKKPLLEGLYRQWRALADAFLLPPYHARQFDAVSVRTSYTGFAYWRNPLLHGTRLTGRFPSLTDEEQLDLAVRLANLLRTVHGCREQPKRRILEICVEETGSPPQTWKLYRSPVWRKLARLAETARSDLPSCRLTPALGISNCLNVHLSWHGELFFLCPPLLHPANPWLDLACLAGELGRADRYFRELLIDIYFFLDVPETFFSVYFLHEYTRLYEAALASVNRPDEQAALEEAARALLNDYPSVSCTVPVWYDRSPLIRKIRENGGVARL